MCPGMPIHCLLKWMLSAALSTLTVDCTDNCEGPGGRGWWRRQAPGAEQWLPNCVPSCQPHAQPHYHMKRHRRTFSFSPNDCSPQSCRGWGARGDTLLTPLLTMEHKVLAEGTHHVPRGCFWLQQVAVSQSMPWQMTATPPPHLVLRPPLEMSRQPVLCAFPWLASGAAAVHWYVHSSRPAGLTGSDSGFYHIWPSELWGCQPASIVSFLCFDWLRSGLGEWWDLGVCGEGKPLSQVQRTFNSLLVFWSVWARAEHTGSAAGRSLCV